MILLFLTTITFAADVFEFVALKGNDGMKRRSNLKQNLLAHITAMTQYNLLYMIIHSR